MYPVSNSYLAAVYNDAAETNLTGTIGSATFTKDNIVLGSFHISNQCTDTSDVVLGSVFLGQLTCTFIDVEIAYTNWIGKDITPTLSVKVGENAWESVPLGVFRIMEAKHTAEGVMVTAYDNMRKFDRKIKKAHFKNVVGSLYTFVATMCTDCHVTLGMSQSDFEDLPNATEEVTIFGYTNETKKYSNDIETYRDLLFYVAQTMGCFATIDRNGQLVFRNYKSNVAETISDRQRLSGAQFADYITNYTGIYVTNMKDDTEDYYGYDVDLIDAEIALVNQELQALDTAIDELEQAYQAHEITEEEYLRQKKIIQRSVKQCDKRLNWLYKAKAKAQAGEEGTFMDLGPNPFLQSDNNTKRERMRKRVLKALDPISYTPFICDSVMGMHYDLGDVIYFTGGHAGSDGVFCCLMAFDWTYNAEYQMQGFGVDPSISNTKTRTQKQSKSANTNAVTAIENAQTAQDTADSKAQDFVSTAYPFADQGKDGDIAVVMMPPFPMKHVADYPGWKTDLFEQNRDGTYKIELSGHTITTGSDPNTVCFEISGFEETGTYHVDCSVKFLGSQGGAWVQGLGPYINHSLDHSPNSIWVISGQEGQFIADSSGGGLINIELGSEWHDYSFDFRYDKILSPGGKMWLMITTDRNYIYGPETPASMFIDNFKITGNTTKPYKVKTIQVKKDGRWNNVDYDDEIENVQTSEGGELIANIKNSDGSTKPIYQKKVAGNPNNEQQRAVRSTNTALKNLQIGTDTFIVRAQNVIVASQRPLWNPPAIDGDIYARICDKSGIYINYDGDHASDIWNPKYFNLTEADSKIFYKYLGENDRENPGTDSKIKLLIRECPVGESVTFDLTVKISRTQQASTPLSYDSTKPLGVCFYDPSDSLPTLPTDKTGAWHSDINYQEFNIDNANDGGTVYTYACTFTAMSSTVCACIDMGGLVLNDSEIDKEIDFRIAPHDMELVVKNMYLYDVTDGTDGEADMASKWFDITPGSGGGGSSDVQLVEKTQAEYDQLTPEQKADPNVIYFITDAGGGGGGGGTGSGYSETVLFTGSGSESTYALSDSIQNYDLIEVQIKYSQLGDYRVPTLFPVSDFETGITYRATADDWYVGFVYTDDTTFTNADSRNAYITEIKGIKCGSGGGGGTTVIANPTGTPTDQLNTVQIGNTIYEIAGGGSGGGITTDTTELFNSTISTTGTYTLDDDYENYDFLTIIGGIQSDEQYGCKEVRCYSVAGLKEYFDANSNNNVLFTGYAYRYFRFRIDNDVLTIQDYGDGQGLYTIYGHKFTGGGGGSSQINSEIVTQKNIRIDDGTEITLNLTKKYTNPYVYATNTLPKTGWGGLVVVNMDYGITYDSTNDTLSFKTYTNYAQNYDIYWLITEMSN